MKHTTVKQWLYYARDLLMETEDRHEAEFQAKCMLSHVLKCKLTQLSFCAEEILGEDQLLQLKDLLAHRLKGEPLQYLLGSWEFMGLEFLVAPGVLIPRQDTETIVEYALQLHKKRRFHSVLDLCCGSGCIGISLSKLTDMHVTAVDIDPQCIELTKKNAEKNQVFINTCVSDLFENIQETYDLIVCNPPYLTLQEMSQLQREVQFEPSLALYGGEDGLFFYQKIAASYQKYLNPNGVLLLEIGCNQGDAVSELFHTRNVIKDINGLDRVICKDTAI